ncbi:Deubiquitinase DESI2 [Halotydeus destructor]|nr:Deubiquitinase DESI2 [Halotydeus destructor]
MAREPIKLNVYDMCTINQYTSRLGVGVFHSGIQVYGIEYGYGGHPFEVSGVFEMEPRDEEALGEETFRYKETIIIGYTDFSDDEIRELVKSMGEQFKGHQYHLLHKNCNHFCDSLSKTLCGSSIPSWVNRLAYISTCVPFLERCIPKEILTPAALERELREHTGLHSRHDSHGSNGMSPETSTTSTGSTVFTRKNTDKGSDVLKKTTSNQW